MAINTYALSTITRIKNRLSITVTDWDTVLTRMLYSVTAAIEQQTRSRFLRTTYTQELYDGSSIDGTPKRWLILKNCPVVSISSFQYRTGAKSNPTWVDFQADTYQERLASGTIYVQLPPGYQNIRVSYIAGFLIDFTNENDGALHTLPYDLTDLCERVVIKLFKKRESEGRSSETFNQSSINWKSDVFDDYDNTILANYSTTEFV